MGVSAMGSMEPGGFVWEPQPEAAMLVEKSIGTAIDGSSFVSRLADRLQHETGTRLIDWLDRITAPRGIDPSKFGWRLVDEPGGKVWIHPAAQLPPLIPDGPMTVAIKTESVVSCMMALAIDLRTPILGGPRSGLRRACLSKADGVEVHAVERHGALGWVPDGVDPTADALAHHEQTLRLRLRDGDDDLAGFQHAMQRIGEAINDLGVQRTCDLFFAAERGYWQGRNRAAQLQKMRQDRLGLGWANHDHHTYRSGRLAFKHLVAALEKLGLHCRERFYPGHGAGWGAQVMENPITGIIVFADVDLSPSEIRNDFAHLGLDDTKELGTVGLWCALHGEAFLQAGMHHLEAQFDFDGARDQLKGIGIGSMQPFTDMPHLRQCFTVGERWSVDARRIDRIVHQGRITLVQAEQFRTQGAIGSHLEILQRDAGYKGFNQTGISEIIKETDPRHAAPVG
jgi:hypothetical protein